MAQLKGSPYATEAGPIAVTVSPSGAVVYVATDAQTVDSFAVSPTTGQLSNAGSTWYGTDCGSPNSLALDPQGGYLYAACSQEVSAAVVGPPLAIAASTGVDGQVVGSMTMRPTGNTIHVVVTAGLGILPIDVSGFDMILQNWVLFNGASEGLGMDPFGRFAYAMEDSSNVVQAESIAENGSMTEVSGSPFSAGNRPVAAAVDYSGKFLYVVNQNDNNISEYSINQTSGALAPLAPPTVASGKGPTSIVVIGTLK